MDAGFYDYVQRATSCPVCTYFITKVYGDDEKRKYFRIIRNLLEGNSSIDLAFGRSCSGSNSGNRLSRWDNPLSRKASASLHIKSSWDLCRTMRVNNKNQRMSSSSEFPITPPPPPFFVSLHHQIEAIQLYAQPYVAGLGLARVVSPLHYGGRSTYLPDPISRVVIIAIS